MAGGGLRTGYEHDIRSGAALAADREFDPYRVLLPWNAIIAQRDFTTDASAGGYLIFTKTGEPQDALRPWSVALSAGVTTLPNLRENLTIPMVDTDVTGGWIATEADSATPADPVVGVVSISPKTYAAVTRFTHQFARQAPAEQFLRQQLLRVAGRALDKAVLGGSALDGEPRGIINVSTIQTESGASLDLDTILTMRGDVAAANDTKLAWIASPAVRKLLAGRQTVTGGSNMLLQNNQIDGRPFFTTPDAPDDVLYLADWSQIVIGLWGPGHDSDDQSVPRF